MKAGYKGIVGDRGIDGIDDCRSWLGERNIPEAGGGRAASMEYILFKVLDNHSFAIEGDSAAVVAKFVNGENGTGI